MNEKFYLGSENYESESLLIENGMTPSISFNDLSDAEKADFMNETLNFNVEWNQALEMCR